MPRGLLQVALSISCLSPIVRRPDAFAATKIASLIFRPERRFLALTSFQSLRRPILSFGSSSFISLRRQSLSLSRARLRPPGNIQSPSRFRLTSSTRPRFAATSFEDFAIPYIAAYTEWRKLHNEFTRTPNACEVDVGSQSADTIKLSFTRH